MTTLGQEPARNPHREREFLTRASACAGTSRFVAQAEARLARGQEAFGDRWAEIPLTQFLTELGEEAADLGAWAVLADQAIDLHLPGLPAHIREGLLEIARAGARAHRIVDAMRRFLPDPTTPEGAQP